MLEPLVNFAMIFAPILGYLPQYQLIRKTGNIGGFSLLTGGVVLWACILRIFFWYAKRFEVVLLLQAIVMGIAQIVLLQACVNVNGRAEHTPKVWTAAYWGKFWDWDQLDGYLSFLIMLSGSAAALQILFGKSTTYVEILGSVALGLEACLAFPQAWKIYRTKSVKGLSYSLVGTWLAGDAFKTWYFVTSGSPSQFIACGIIQLAVDILIVAMIAMYQ